MTIAVSVITTANHNCRYTLDKTDSINRLLDSLGCSAQLFTGKPLIIGSPEQTDVFAASSIVCIELATALDLDSYLPGGQNLSVTTLAGEELAAPFGGRFDNTSYRVRIDLFFHGGHVLHTCVEGERKPVLAERLTSLTGMFERPVIGYRLPQGGIGLLNPKAVTRSRIIPGAPDLPRDAWLADPA